MVLCWFLPYIDVNQLQGYRAIVSSSAHRIPLRGSQHLFTDEEAWDSGKTCNLMVESLVLFPLQILSLPHIQMPQLIPSSPCF